MDLMKSSISAIIKNIETAETYLDEKSIENFMNIINESDNVFVMEQVDLDLLEKHLQWD